MIQSPIKVLIVDDSGFMRLLITNMLSEDPELEIMDTAENGQEAFEKTKELLPDVVVLDLIMNAYDGLYAVTKIMEYAPRPIIILSSLDSKNSDLAIRALEAGAFDFVSKPKGAFHSKVRKVKEELVAGIKRASQANTESLHLEFKKNTFPHSFEAKTNYDVIILGASTGGTSAIELILNKIPENLPIPIIIAQHIPQSFGESFTKRLDDMLPLPVTMAFEHTPLKNGMIYVLPSHSNTQLINNPETQSIHFQTTTDRYLYNNPSIDGLLLSAAKIFGSRSLSVILTGMGRDGALGTQALYQQGGFTIVQDEQTSVVFGMPKAAIELGAVRKVLPLPEIANFIVSCL